jgi:hypothetical protein
MMSVFERRKIAEAVVALGTGQLPGPRDHVPVIKLKQRRVRVLRANFYHADRVPQKGEVISLDAPEAAGLVARGLAEFV